jgi:hypothetical protein
VNETQVILQRYHAKNRAFERCHIFVNRKIYRVLNAKIKCGEAKFIKNKPNGSSLWLVKHENKNLIVAYDNRSQQIVTY